MGEVEGLQWPLEHTLSHHSGHTLLGVETLRAVGHSWPKPGGLPSWPLDLWHLPKAYDPARAEIDKADV